MDEMIAMPLSIAKQLTDFSQFINHARCDLCAESEAGWSLLFINEAIINSALLGHTNWRGITTWTDRLRWDDAKLIAEALTSAGYSVTMRKERDCFEFTVRWGND